MLNTVLSIINIVLWVLLALALGLSFLRGFKRSINRLISAVIVTLIAFLLSSLFIDIVCGIKMGNIIGENPDFTIVDVVESTVKEALEVEELKENSLLSELILSLSKTIVKIPIFLVLYILLLLTVRPIITLILNKIMPLPKGKSPLMRLAGVGISVITYFVIFWSFTFIILGSLSLITEFNDYYQKTIVTNTKQEVEAEEDMMAEIMNVVHEVENISHFKILGLVSGKNFALQKNVLGSFIEIKTTNGNLNIVKEFKNIAPLCVVLINEDTSDIERLLVFLLNNREKIINVLRSSEIVNIGLPIAVEILEYQKLDINLDSLKDVDWKIEKNNVLDALIEVLNVIAELEIDFDDPIQALGNKKLPDCLSRIGKALEKSTLVKDVILVYLNDILQEALEKDSPELSEFKDIVNIAKLNLENDLPLVGSILNRVYDMGVFEGGEIDFVASKDELIAVINMLFDLSTIKGNEAKTIEAVIRYAGIEESLNEAGIVLAYDQVTDWDQEINIIGNVLGKLAELTNNDFDNLDFVEILKDNANNQIVEELVGYICDSVMFKDTIITLIDNMMKEAELTDWQSSYFKSLVSKENTITNADLKTEMLTLLKCLKDVQNVLVDDIKNIDVANMENVLLNICDSKFVNISKIVDFINDSLLNSDIINVEKKITCPNLNNEEWKEEVRRITNVLTLIKDNGLLESDMTSLLEDLPTSKLEEILLSLNSSLLFRQILPDLLDQAITFEEYKTLWLKEQCGIDINGENNIVLSQEIWKDEINNLSAAIIEAKKFDLANMDITEMTDSEYDDLEHLLKLMNNCQTFSLDVLVQDINKAVEAQGYDTRVIGIVDRNSNDSNKEEWDAEITGLVEILKQLKKVGTIGSIDNPTRGAEVGALLNKMKTSYLFGNDTKCDKVLTTDDDIFNTLIIEVLRKSSLIKNSSNPNGFIDETTALNTDWSKYNWEKELQIISEFDPNIDVQDDETIKHIVSSDVVKDFFDIAGFVNKKIEGKEITIAQASLTLKLEDYVNGGKPLTNEDLKDRDWSKEIDDMTTISEAFTSYGTGFKVTIDTLATSGSNTLAAQTASDIKDELQTQTVPGSEIPVWDILA